MTSISAEPAADPMTVVCFGDSLTWGFKPVTGERYGYAERWTRRLQEVLGSSFHIVEEGLNGRTTVFEDPVAGDKNGLAHLETVLSTHAPIDILVIMLGTNNLKNRFNLTAGEIATSMGRLLMLVRKSEAGRKGKTPSILLMAPPCLGDFEGTPMAGPFSGQRANRESDLLSAAYEALAAEHGVHFMDAGSVVTVSPADAIHLDLEMQAPLAEAVAKKVREITA